MKYQGRDIWGSPVADRVEGCLLRWGIMCKNCSTKSSVTESRGLQRMWCSRTLKSSVPFHVHIAVCVGTGIETTFCLAVE
jgi:hypothetical protein